MQKPLSRNSPSLSFAFTLVRPYTNIDTCILTGVRFRRFDSGLNFTRREKDMRKLWLVGLFVLLSASMSSAQSKIVSQWHCDKASAAKTVGDFTHSSCTAVKGGDIGGVKEKEGMDAAMAESTGDNATGHGLFIATAENGDKIHYVYSYTGMAKDGAFQSGSNKWKMVGGTGKFAAVKGEGTCSGKGNADGTVTWDCTGNYTLK